MNLGLIEMLRYNAWASRTLLDACRELTDEQLEARLPATSGPLRELLMHIVGGQQAYVHMAQGRPDTGGLDRQQMWPGMAKLIAVAERTRSPAHRDC
jgi:uncharacterized damage-inducible protein DinB